MPFLRRLPASPGRNAARSLFFLVSRYCHLLRGKKSVWRPVRFTLLGPPGNEEEWEGPTVIDFTEIASELPHFDHGGHPARVNNACQTQARFPTELVSKISDEMPPVSTGRLLRLISPRTFSTSRCRLEQIHRADEAVCRGCADASSLDGIDAVYEDLWQGDGCHEDKRTGRARRLLCGVRLWEVTMRSWN